MLAPCPHPSTGMHELSASVFCPFRSPSEISSLDCKVLEFLGHLLSMWVDMGPAILENVEHVVLVAPLCPVRWPGVLRLVPCVLLEKLHLNSAPHRPQAVGMSWDPPLTLPLSREKVSSSTTERTLLCQLLSPVPQRPPGRCGLPGASSGVSEG